MKKILVLTGSRRVSGNSDLMADAFIRGAESKGCEIMRFDTGRKNIELCKVCGTCFSKGKACSYNDDFEELSQMLQKADAIVISTPLYWFTYPAVLKAAIDKFCAYSYTGRRMNIRESMLLACGATADKRDFDGLVRSYERMAGYLRWNNRGHYLVTGVDNVGDIRSGDVLEKLQKLGEKF